MNKDTIPLTPKQKQIISELSNNKGLLVFYGTPIVKYKFKGKTIPFEMGLDLIRKGVVQKWKEERGNRWYEVSQLGKSINLEGGNK